VDAFAFNPLDEGTRRDPYGLYARARREQPIYAHPGLPLYSVFRYADVVDALRDADAFSSDLRDQLQPFLVNRPDLAEEMPAMMLLRDGANHARQRSLVNQAFTPRIVRALEPRIRAIANELFDAALERKEVDIVDALASPLPVRVIAELIGVPAEDTAQFRIWSDALIADLGANLLAPLGDARAERQIEIIRALHGYFGRLADQRRSQPRDDLLSGLVAAQHEGTRLSRPEMLQMLVLLLVAGNETTTNLIGNAVVELLEHPGELRKLREEPGLRASAVDEVLRFASPVQADVRKVARSTELLGQRVRQGELVILWLGSANRDAQVFDEADRFDVARRENRHLGFGFGKHYCLGANLARLEALVALDVLLDRTRHFERVGPELLPLHPSFVFRSYTRVPVRLVPA